jgi:long-chain acyl-CoA synthetase
MAVTGSGETRAAGGGTGVAIATAASPGATSFQKLFNPDPRVEPHVQAARRFPPGVRFRVPAASWPALFDARVARRAWRPFLVAYLPTGDRLEWSYAQFADRVYAAVRYCLDELGVRPGERIATITTNQPEAIVLAFAAWRLGACIVPVNVEEPAERKAFILDNAEAVAVFARPEMLDQARVAQASTLRLRAVQDVSALPWLLTGTGSTCAQPLPERAGWDDDALLVYTSGTTGAPKGVLLSNANLLADAWAMARWHRFTGHDRFMCVLPVHHVNGLVYTHVTPFLLGGSVVLNPRFSPATFWQRLAAERTRMVSVVPTLLEFLLESNEDTRHYSLAALREVTCGAGPLLVETALRFEERFGIPIMHGYGLSETTAFTCFLPMDLAGYERRRWLADAGFPSIGAPIAADEMAILDANGRPVPDGRRAEICLYGANVCKGYWKRPDANAEAFKWGWFRSGDEGFLLRDEHGRRFFFITGRIKELIIRGGVNISPVEIDDVLRTVPGVRFAMAVPFENRYYGEEIAAYVVPRDDAALTEADVLRACAALPHARRPKVVVFGTDVPYTTTGKPKRLELKKCLVADLARYRDVQFRERGAHA